jgi:class 3 adenylate cyclase
MTSPVDTTIEPKRGYARSGNVHIAYQVLGAGPAEMVHVLPFATPVEIGWELPQIARWWTRIGAFSRSIIFDQRGVGSSDRPESAPTIDEQVGDLEAVVEAVGAERFALAAYSQASPAGIAYAARHPERVTQLVLYGATARVMRGPDYPEGRSTHEARAWVASLASGWGNGGTLDHNQPSVAGDPAIREWVARAERTLGSPAMAVKMAQALGATDVREQARSLRVPTLVLHRREDPAIPFAHGAWLARNVPQARFIELEGRDHALYFGDTSVALQEIEEWVTGTRPVHRAERVLTTLMFTDIAHSTRTAATLGDAEWEHRLARHDAEVRGELRYQGATELDTTGDGFLAEFPTATAAVGAARAIRRRVRQLGLELRIGIHITECERAGANVGGVGVHVAARFCELAEPGEILVSGTVADVLIGSGAQLTPRGEHELKGAPGRWRAYAVDERPAQPRE